MKKPLDRHSWQRKRRTAPKHGRKTPYNKSPQRISRQLEREWRKIAQINANGRRDMNAKRVGAKQ